MSITVRALVLGLLLSLVSTGCKGGADAPDPGPGPAPDAGPGGFTLTLEPATLSIGPGSEARITVGISRAAPFTGPVTLSAAGLPAGLTVRFEPETAPGDTSTLVVTAARDAAPFQGPLPVHGTAGALTASAQASLTVTAALPPPTVTVDPAVTPTRASLPGIAGGPPRPLAALVDGRGKRLEFAEDELVLYTDDTAALQALLARYGGTVLRSSPPPPGVPGLRTLHHVRLDLRAVDAARTAERLAKLEPGKTGTLRLSSVTGQRLLGVLAQEHLGGLQVGLNFVLRPLQAATFEDGVSQESPAGEAGDAFGWADFRRGDPFRFDVANAWRALERAGRLGNRVRVGIVDEGFRSSTYSWTDNADFPPVRDTAGPMGCQGGCSFHGHKVALAAAGLADNGFGAVGPGGPVAELVLSGLDLDSDDFEDAYGALVAVPAAASRGARIVNMSFGGEVPALASVAVLPLDEMTQVVRASGVLLFAAAGNDGIDVDAEDCFVACWEEGWMTPCENDGVICVGGMDDDSPRARHASSNYGFEDVDIWAPYQVLVGPSPDDTGVGRQSVQGTSFSSPFVAGVAALVWAADPGQSAAQVWGRLRSNAIPFGQLPYQRRQVHAFGAVSEALGGTAPRVRILAPADGAGHAVELTHPVTFRASAQDLEQWEDDDCCTYAWRSDVDGHLGSGAELVFDFGPSQGPRTVTVTATDGDGRTHTDSIVYTVRNRAPTATIERPTASQTIYRGQTFLLRGQGTDFVPLPAPLPCERLSWVVRRTTGIPVPLLTRTGCEASASLDGTGSFSVTLTVTDSDGATATATRDFSVVERPEGPWVEIVNPPQGAILAWDDTHVLSLQRSLGSGTVVPTVQEYFWEIIAPGFPVVTYTRTPLGIAPRWTPSETHSISNCGADLTVAVRVTMRLSNGAEAVDAVLVKVRRACIPN